MALPEEKLQEVKETLRAWSTKQKAKKLDIQKLAGSLNWCCRVIGGGRSFIRNIINLIGKARNPDHYVRIGKAAKDDLEWWKTALRIFNGYAPFPADEPEVSGTFATDACLTGGAGHFQSDWFFVNWNIDHPEIDATNINILELKAVLISVHRWSHLWYGKHLTVRSDNASTVAAVNKATSRSPNLIPLIQELFWWSVANNFKITAAFIPGKLNVLSDRLSRLHDRQAAVEAHTILNNSLATLIPCKHHMSQNSFLCLQKNWRTD